MICPWTCHSLSGGQTSKKHVILNQNLNAFGELRYEFPNHAHLCKVLRNEVEAPKEEQFYFSISATWAHSPNNLVELYSN